MSAIKKEINMISEEEFEKKSDLNLIASDFTRKKFHLALISLDLTYLNNITNNHTLGDDFMKEVQYLIKVLINSKKIQYEFKASGKFFILAEHELNNIKKDFFTLEENFLKKTELGLSRKIIYFLDYSDSHLSTIEKDFFTIGPFSSNEKELLNEVFNLNFYLDKQREYLQEAIRDNFKKDLSNLFQREKELSNDIKSKKKFFNLDYLMQLNNDDFLKEIRILKSRYKSVYISQILDLLQTKKFNPSVPISQSLLIIGSKSLFFFQFQKVLFILFKLEKVYKLFERITPKNETYSRNPILLFERGDSIELRKKKLATWISSSMQLLEPSFTIEQRNEYMKILEIIQEAQSFPRSLQITLSQRIQCFFDNLYISGFCSQSLSSISFEGAAEKFLQWQFNQNYGLDGPKLLETRWKNNSILIRSGETIFKSNTFYAALSRPELVPMMYNNLNDSIMLGSWRLHSVFIELDAFNTFNFYQFVDETDKLYKEIIYFIYEEAYNIIEKNKDDNEILDLFSTMLSSILGDEFYFFFLTKNEISVSQKKVIISFMNAIKNKIIDITKNFIFPKTMKVLVSTQRGDIIFRRIIEENTISGNFELEVARVGVSGALISNGILDFRDPHHSEYFLNSKKILEGCVNLVKENKKPTLIENKRERKKMKNTQGASLMEFSVSGKGLFILDKKTTLSERFNFVNIFK